MFKLNDEVQLTRGFGVHPKGAAGRVTALREGEVLMDVYGDHDTSYWTPLALLEPKRARVEAPWPPVNL